MKKNIMILFIIIMCMASNVFANGGNYEVHFLDTGQSDCILIKAENKNYLIDTGAEYYSNKILKYLNLNGINEIDTIILTHYHDDHYSGLLKIADSRKVKKVLLPMHNNKMKYSIYKELIERNINVKYIGNNYEIKNRKMNLTTIAPIKEDKRVENNNSIILQGEIDGISYLFAGDCEKEEEEYMLGLNKLKVCQILKVPHHGLDTSTTENFLKKICPKIAVVTCNGVETPDMKVINRMCKKGIIVMRTDLEGNIVIKNAILKMSKSGLNIGLFRNKL